MAVFFFLGVLTLIAAIIIYLAIVLRGLPSPDQIGNQQISQSTKIYDRTGQVLLYEIHGEQKRTIVSFDEIPTIVKQATLAAEDASFYQEPAFDWKGIVRALFVDIKQGQITQGGSTISQQLVKNVFLSDERTFDRKLKELALAVELETHYTKDQILAFYLNEIPYGSNAYGIEAASQTFFGKSVKDITLAEAATLASLPKGSYYSPWGDHVSDLLARKDSVLDHMLELGFISKADHDAAKQQVLKFAPPSLGLIKAPHFSLAVKDYLTSRYGDTLVENGGLKVITTLDWGLQQIAEKAVEEGSANNQQTYGAKNAAMAVQDPQTGQILALVGSRDYFDVQNGGNFDVVTQGLRQPGSALKPFVYMTAFQKGYSPKTVVDDVSIEFDSRNADDPTKSYRPADFDNQVRGPVHLENALAQSLNIPAVQVLYLAGFDDVLNNLHSFGITTLNERWRYGLSLTLGGGEIKLIDLLNAYSTLSQEGVRHDQSMVLSVTDSDGNTLEQYHDNSSRVADPQNPRLVTQILSDPQLREPIFGNTLPLTVFPDHEVALKTGTTEDHRDAWAFGYTPSLTVGVWAGNNDNTPMIRQGSSILAAIPIWSAFLKAALPLYPPDTFTRPDPISLPNKPMLNGEAVSTPTLNGVSYPQFHSILYYVNPSDPLGPAPQDPTSDPQFKNWESAVLDWGKSNIPNFSSYNQPIPPGAVSAGSASGTAPIASPSSSTTITNITPGNGSFVSSPFTINADIASPRGLERLELYFNGGLINAFAINGTSYHYQYNAQLGLAPQNQFEIRVTDLNGNQSSASFIVYH